MQLELEQAAEAFGMLTEGRPETLIDLLDSGVTWVEYLGERPSQTLSGAEAVAGLLRGLLDHGARVELTGIAKVGADRLELAFRNPWWLERRSVGSRLACLLFGEARQTVTVGERIERIESHATYFSPSATELDTQAQEELVSLLRT